MKSNQYVLGE